VGEPIREADTKRWLEMKAWEAWFLQQRAWKAALLFIGFLLLLWLLVALFGCLLLLRPA
jgi:hypothetical protein